MDLHHRSSERLRPSISFILLCVFLVICLLAGGASREDALGQVGVRLAAWTILIGIALLGRVPHIADTKPVAVVLASAVLLPLLQLVPVPPMIWHMFPGRQIVSEYGSGPDQWRPLTLAPGATWNAAGALIVPITALLLLTGLSDTDRRRLPGLVLLLIGASTIIGLLQFSGAGIDNPLINEMVGEVSGTFANRNHFAMFLACGCLLAPAWAFLDERNLTWRGPVAVGSVLLFTLVILASGSRAGLGLGLLAMMLGLFLVRRRFRRALSRYPRWVFPALVAGFFILLAIAVLSSVAADRAVSIGRAFSVDPGQDMRQRALPTILSMIRDYFPIGSGLGGFDPVFRMHEPFDLLRLIYFNHAHNDYLEIALDAGLPGITILAGALFWWARASVRSWRSDAETTAARPRLGSAILLLIMIASAFDYPARTPMIMVLAVIGGVWLCENRKNPAHLESASALRANDQHL